MTPLNELEPQQDDKPTLGVWTCLPPEDGIEALVVSRLGEHVIPVGEFDSYADALLCSYAPEMLQTLRTVHSRLETIFGEGELCKQIAAVIKGATGRR